MIRSGGEVDLSSRRGCGIVITWTDIPRAEGPNAIDGQRFSACILEQSVKFPGRQVVSGNEAAGLAIAATRKLADQQFPVYRKRLPLTKACQASETGSVAGFDYCYSERRRRCGPLGYSYSWIPASNRRGALTSPSVNSPFAFTTFVPRAALRDHTRQLSDVQPNPQLELGSVKRLDH